MTDADLRALVRDAVARHLGSGSSPAHELTSSPVHQLTSSPAHPSHLQFTLVNIGDACLIEPAVECTHCGYCKSHGH